jgi:hypothetical protein
MTWPAVVAILLALWARRELKVYRRYRRASERLMEMRHWHG